MKINNNIKKCTAIIAIAMIIVTLCVPAYAVTSEGYASWEEITPVNRTLFAFHDTGIISNPDNIIGYACCGKLGSSSRGVIFCTLNNNYSNVNIQGPAQTKNFSVNVKTITYNGTTVYLSFAGAGNNDDNYYTLAEFTNDGTPNNLQATQFLDYVINQGGGGSNTGSEINYSLPAGNIAIIETDSNYSYINLTTTMPLQSTSFANNPWPNTTQRIGYYGTLPQTLNPNTMGNVIEWERNGNTTLFNVTTSAKYNPSVVSTFKYVVIANPYYYPANDMDDSQYTNGSINISMDGVVNITVKSLTATVNTQTGAVEDNYNGTEWTGEIDEDTNDIIWTDGNGENNAPTSGGNLSDPSISGFQSWLKGILNNIVNIFEPAHDAISTLSGAVSNFASWMYALYVWLPSPILSLLTSAISLAIVIGIIKVFI